MCEWIALLDRGQVSSHILTEDFHLKGGFLLTNLKIRIM